MIIIEEYLIIEKVIIVNVQQSFLNLGGWGKGIVSPSLNFEGLKIHVSDEIFSLVQFSSVAQSCPALCDPMDCSTPGLPVYHQLLELTQTHVL